MMVGQVAILGTKYLRTDGAIGEKGEQMRLIDLDHFNTILNEYEKRTISESGRMIAQAMKSMLEEEYKYFGLPQADHIAKAGKMDKAITADLYGYRVPPEQWAGWINGKGGEIKPEEIWKDRPHIILYSTTVRRYIIPMNDRGMPDFMAAEEDRRGAARFNRLFHEEDDTEERVRAGLQDGVKQIAQMFRGNGTFGAKKGKT